MIRPLKIPSSAISEKWLIVYKGATMDSNSNNCQNLLYACLQQAKYPNTSNFVQIFIYFTKRVKRASYNKLLKSDMFAEHVLNWRWAVDFCTKFRGRIDGPWSLGNIPISKNIKKKWIYLSKSAPALGF